MGLLEKLGLRGQPAKTGVGSERTTAPARESAPKRQTKQSSRRDWQLYKAEAEAMGEEVKDYGTWASEQ
ncbi:hypothetical protein [Caldimonas sp. KR1-144]|uniref:hypothetical protein n=1 Tax=Caldimonas sp. KR1-144 TaxID=3400911 RepID=UPI003C0B1AF5